ncbi:MAG: PsbP-related protein [Clostridiaceae bacterium]
MHIIIIPNYRRKLLISMSAAVIWILLFIFGSYLIDHTMLFHITINSCLEFSCPYDIIIENVLVSYTDPQHEIRASFSPAYPRVGHFINYESLEGKFSFNYPSAFLISEETFTGGDILYHIDFRDRQDSAHGFIQVWKLTDPLEEFLKKSKETSQETYKYFKTSDIELNGVKGYLWDYAVLTQNGYYKGMEVFLEQDERMYRLSYFLPESKWNNKQSELFWIMAKSFKIK